MSERLESEPTKETVPQQKRPNLSALRFLAYALCSDKFPNIVPTAICFLAGLQLEQNDLIGDAESLVKKLTELGFIAQEAIDMDSCAVPDDPWVYSLLVLSSAYNVQWLESMPDDYMPCKIDDHSVIPLLTLLEFCIKNEIPKNWILVLVDFEGSHRNLYDSKDVAVVTQALETVLSEMNLSSFYKQKELERRQVTQI